MDSLNNGLKKKEKKEEKKKSGDGKKRLQLSETRILVNILYIYIKSECVARPVQIGDEPWTDDKCRSYFSLLIKNFGNHILSVLIVYESSLKYKYYLPKGLPLLLPEWLWGWGKE